ETQLDYWKRQLAGAPSLLELPTDHPRPSVQTLRGATERLEMPVAIAEGLKRLGREEGATLFMTLLAAFQVLLHRYTGQTDLLVGTATAGRDRAEVQSLIGFFVNTLVLRADLSGDPGFREFLRRVRGVTLGAYAHQDVPFEKLVEELNPERSLSYAPLFQVAFGFEPLQDEERLTAMPGLTMTAFRNDNETAKFDLVLYVFETAGGLSAALHYSSDLFEQATVKRLLGHFRTLLEGVIRRPEQALSELPLLGEAERHEILYEWNATEVEYPRDKCIHELFEQRAARTPDTTAVVYEGRRLTYGELDARANQLAHHLRGLGVGAEVAVGLCCDRSPEMLVGLLGILKAGGAYVPLDPAYPLERLSFIIEDAAMPVLLVQEHLLDSLPAHWGQVVCLDADWETIAAESERRPAPVASPDNVAYVIYTSGSTGRPKGVEIAHRGMLNMAQAQVRAFSLRPENRVIQFASLSFDASVFEIVMGLTNGAELHLARRDELLPGTSLLDLLRERRVTNVTLPPSALALLPQAELPDLHTIIVAGEACGAELVKRWARDGRRFFNAYGPSEATVWASVAECRDATRKPDIGRPIDNVQLYVLDGHLRPVPVGVAGELHIGGAGLARGYLRRPGLTAERFVPDPFGAEPGARLYKTGDRARFLPGGRIDFLGRLDDQVKVRGFRIELGEVEAALLEHVAVREALVVAREDEPGDRRLVAYLTSAGESAAAPPVDELRAFLRGKLPDYMIPAAFVFLDALPVSPNGKVDRRQLPAPGHERPAFETDYVAPRDAVEEMLAGMWRETLGVERIGVRDDFFGLGGDSIKGAVFINSLQSRLDDIVHVVTIFNAPTVEQLADYLRGQHADALARAGLVSPAHAADNGNGHGAPAPARRVTAEQLAHMRRLIRPLPARDGDGRGESPDAESRRNPPAVFVLSPPRSGSTLFRVMLAGHPELFSPPELELLSFNTLAERRTAFSGADSFWLEGALRALMEVRRCDAA
ncbi:MAG TPA: amino acid adenylation domain-containing protein, partial [Pyrinomonadaceae bacterium]|nr:amino acid adenylation domain-containing protein [Pyrinomonadaceae bacterium]